MLGAGEERVRWRFDFMGRSKFFFAMSGCILLIGSFAVATKELNFGIDFESGTRVTAALERDTSVEAVRNAINPLGLNDAKIQTVRNPELGDHVIQIKTAELGPGGVQRVERILDRDFGVTSEGFSSESVGPTFGKTVARSATIAIIASLLLIMAYVALRFEPKFAIPVMIALFHDLLITAGVYALSGREVTTSTVAAVLTILGFSLYDCVIVFDRIRENAPRMPRAAFSQIVNRSMSEVMTRSLATSFCTLLPITALLLFGGETLTDFAFALLVGIASGTYSSIFIAAPVLTEWKEREPAYRQRRRRIETDLGHVPAFAASRPARPTTLRPCNARSGLPAARPRRSPSRSRSQPPRWRRCRSIPTRTAFLTTARTVPTAQPSTGPRSSLRPWAADSDCRPGRARGAQEAAPAAPALAPQARAETLMKGLMNLLVWVMMGIAIWHFAVFVPDRFWGGIVGAFGAAAVGRRRGRPDRLRWQHRGHEPRDGARGGSRCLLGLAASLVLRRPPRTSPRLTWPSIAIRPTAFLASAGGRSADSRWRAHPYDYAQAHALASALGLSHTTASVLVRRGLGDPAAARALPRGRRDPRPGAVRGMDDAVADRAATMSARRSLIAVHGDYDVDGVCSTACSTSALRSLGARRCARGCRAATRATGSSRERVEELHRAGAALLITVDCGITATAEVELAQRARHGRGGHRPPPARAASCPGARSCTPPWAATRRPVRHGGRVQAGRGAVGRRPGATLPSSSASSTSSRSRRSRTWCRWSARTGRWSAAACARSPARNVLACAP